MSLKIKGNEAGIEQCGGTGEMRVKTLVKTSCPRLYQSKQDIWNYCEGSLYLTNAKHLAI